MNEFEKWAKSYGLQHYSNEWALLTDGKTEIYQDVFKAGAAAMREKAADIAEAHAHNGKECCRNKADTIKDAIRKLRNK